MPIPPDDSRNWCKVTIHLKPLTIVMERAKMQALNRAVTEQAVGDDATILTLNGKADAARQLPALVTVDLDQIAALSVTALPLPVRRRRARINLAGDGGSTLIGPPSAAELPTLEPDDKDTSQ